MLTKFQNVLPTMLAGMHQYYYKYWALHPKCVHICDPATQRQQFEFKSKNERCRGGGGDKFNLSNVNENSQTMQKEFSKFVEMKFKNDAETS